MRRILLCLMLATLFCPWAHSQTEAKTTFGKEFLKPWKRHKIYTLRLAEAMDEEAYSYKPGSESRSFAELALHMAGANYMFSSVTAGEEFPVDRSSLDATGKTKEEIVNILSASFDYAEGVLKKVTQSRLNETSAWKNPIEPSTTRTYAEVFHVMREHAAHHRGQMTVYLRLKGITPPAFID